MKIFITGGAGCLGSNLVEHWLPKGYELIVLDNFETGKKELVPDGIEGLIVYEGDVADYTMVKNIIDTHQPEIVIHSAASYNDPNDWQKDATTNVIGSINIAKASVNSTVKQIINFQTALCFGIPQQIPINRDHPTRPFTSYGISKTAGESFLLNGDVPVISLRLANICGPRLAIGPIPTFYKRLKTGANCFCSDTTRDFLDMSDFFALMDIIVKTKPNSGVFNVSTGIGNTIKDIFDEVCVHLGKQNINVPIIPPGEDDVQHVVLDPSDTQKVFGWKANINFKDTIAKQLSWYDAHGISDIHSHLKEPSHGEAS